ncbi:hypothetical protein FKM82_001207 [Ascaphus truei]
MKTCGILILITFIFVWVEIPSVFSTNERERKGFCPFNDIPAKVGVKEKSKCSSDFECEKNAKCCSRGSSRDCLPASMEKPGRCPLVCKLPLAGPQCTSDSDCLDNLKCCYNCGQACVKPDKVVNVFPLN